VIQHRHHSLRASVVLGSALLLSQGLAVQAAPRPMTDRTTPTLAPGMNIEGVTQRAPAVVPREYRGDVRDLPQVPYRQMSEANLIEPSGTKKATSTATHGPKVPVAPLAPMPTPLLTFAGLSLGDICSGVFCGGGWPPDTNGDVGPTNYIQAVNTSYASYSKTGTLQASFTEDSLWSGSGSNPCNGTSQGDPIVLYDTIADRWILSHFAWASDAGPFYQCIAASKTSDPVSGGWWLYPIQTDLGTAGTPPAGTLNDYGKFGLWTDCLYFAANGFSMPSGAFNGTEFASFSRSDLYAGATLHWAIGFLANTVDPFTMIPSNLDGSPAGSLPPTGTPNYFVSESNTDFAFEVRRFTAGPNCGAGGTLSTPTNVSQTSYAIPPGLVAQPGTLNGLDPIPDRLMQKVQYRKVGSAESLWVVHTVQTPSATTVSPQWAQLDVTGGMIAMSPVQQQIFSPDSTLNRWMGSIAADKEGNVALGYSTSNGSSPNFPSIAYAGRLATDPLNALPRTEVQLVAGAGSQTNNCGGAPCERWGDYTAMSVDPVDDCTFWYTNEYYDSPANGTSGNWHTRIGSFKFPTCIAAPTITSVTPANGPTAGGTTVTITGAGLSGATAVAFGGTAAPSFTVNSGTSITAASPAGSGTVDVTVTTPGGTSATSSADHFIYLVGSVVSTCDQAHLATAVAAGGTVTFTCSGTISLTSTITSTLTTVLDGTGQSVTIDGGGSVGLFFDSGGSFGVVNLRLQDGNTAGGGGAISSVGSVTVTNSTFNNNQALSQGAIAAGQVTVSGSTFVNNTTTGGLGDGGAIGAGFVSVTNSTFVGNHGGLGGAIVGFNGLTSVSSTFVDNVGNGTIELDQGTATLKNTILSGGGPECFLGASGAFTLTDLGGNFSDDASCAFTHASSHNSVAVATLALGSLASNGGPTQTVALQPGSVAIDAGVSCPPPSTDQRGVARSIGAACDSGGYEFTGATYVSLTPARILDTRSNTGLAGTFSTTVPRSLQVTGVGGVPSDAVAVTGNLTVTNQTSPGFLALTTVSTPSPSTSTLNFPLGDNRANGVTAPLGAGGVLWITYSGSVGGATTDVLFDVTGYFEPTAGGATYVSLTPARILDTRSNTGLAGTFSTTVPRSLQVTGVGGVPSDAVAVTGNLTVTNQTSPGFLALTTVSTPSPSTSTLNFPLGDNRANGVTAPLGAGGVLWITYSGSVGGATTDVIFDVTGYFEP
jgi:IPT/TIG domain